MTDEKPAGFDEKYADLKPEDLLRPVFDFREAEGDLLITFGGEVVVRYDEQRDEGLTALGRSLLYGVPEYEVLCEEAHGKPWFGEPQFPDYAERWFQNIARTEEVIERVTGKTVEKQDFPIDVIGWNAGRTVSQQGRFHIFHDGLGRFYFRGVCIAHCYDMEAEGYEVVLTDYGRAMKEPEKVLWKLRQANFYRMFPDPVRG